MNNEPLKNSPWQNISHFNVIKTSKFHKQSKSLVFTSNVNFDGPFRVISPETEQALNLYMTTILTSTIETTSKGVKNFFTPIFQKLMLESKTENSFYKKLSGAVDNFISKGNFIRSNNRKNCYADRTMTMLAEQKLPQNAVYLDIGCGNGVVTRSISDSLNIEAKNVYGLEVFEPGIIDGVNVVKYNGYDIPKCIPNSDLVTLYTVLHHMKDKEQAGNLLKSVYNKMNDGGFLLIREHEVNSEQDESFWRIVHDINTKIMKRTSSDLNNGTLYKSSDYWVRELESLGFKSVKKWYDLSYNKQKSYFLLVQK